MTSTLHVNKPTIYGFRNDLSFTNEQCEKMKIMLTFAGVKAKDWTSIEILARVAAKNTTPRRKAKTAIAYHSITEIFTNIHRHNPTMPGVKLYCDKIKTFLNHKSVKMLFRDEFIKSYKELEDNREQSELESQTCTETEKNGLKVKLRGAKRVGEEFDKELADINKKKSKKIYVSCFPYACSLFGLFLR